MRAELRYLHSPDARGLDQFEPENPEHFGILVQAMIGPADGRGEESFDFVYCSPSWVDEEIRGHGPRWLRHYLVDRSYDVGRLRKAVLEVCAGVVGDTWEEVARGLARHGRWEFEDYRKGA